MGRVAATGCTSRSAPVRVVTPKERLPAATGPGLFDLETAEEKALIESEKGDALWGTSSAQM